LKDIRAVIFDLDGTVVDAPYDWREIRNQMGVSGLPILSYLEGLEEPAKSRQMRLLDKFEKEATKKAKLKPGMKKFHLFLKKQGLQIALVTNNSRPNVEFLRRKFGLRFDAVLTRESGLWKPSGAPFREVMAQLGVQPEQCAVIGDSLYDLKAGQEAGIKNIFILWERKGVSAPEGAEIFSSVSALQRRFVELLGVKKPKVLARAGQPKKRSRVPREEEKRS